MVGKLFLRKVCGGITADGEDSVLTEVIICVVISYLHYSPVVDFLQPLEVPRRNEVGAVLVFYEEASVSNMFHLYSHVVVTDFPAVQFSRCYNPRSNRAVTRVYKLVTFTDNVVAAVYVMLCSDDKW